MTGDCQPVLTEGRWNVSLLCPANINVNQSYDCLDETCQFVIGDEAIGDKKLFKKIRALFSRAYIRCFFYKGGVWLESLIEHVYGPAFKLHEDTPEGIKVSHKFIVDSLKTWGSGFQNGILMSKWPLMVSRAVLSCLLLTLLSS